VWLEAPYGYGKSVLAAQWADELEKEGWRVEWLSLGGRDARAAIAGHLGFPPTTPWPVLSDELWSSPTLLVLEDLQGGEDPGPLLREGRGLVLLASRQPLPYPELSKLETAGRLQHLVSSDLAFAEAEAAGMFQDAGQAREAWRQTHGWPLPLHFAALTGDLPEKTSLLAGVERSVSPDAWRELLFVATLETLPETAAVEATGELVRSGFLQRLTGGYRLHPLMADSVIAANGDGVRAQVAAQGDRLPPALRAAAFEKADHTAGLHDLLVSGEGVLFEHSPEAFLRWHELVEPSPEPARRVHVAIANLLLNRFDAALPGAVALATDPEVAPEARARLIGAALFALGSSKRFEQAEAFRLAADKLVPSLPPHPAGVLQQNLGTFEFSRGDFAAAEERYASGLAALARAEPSLVVRQAQVRLLANLQSVVWEARGDVDGPLASQRELIARPDLDEASYVILHQNLAVNSALSCDDETAKTALRKVLARSRAYMALVIRSNLAYLERDVAAFPSLLAAARKWEAFELAERVSALWLRVLRREGDFGGVVDLYRRVESGPFSKLELAWARAGRGELREAAALLHETEGAYAYREFRVHWHAVAYMVERSAERLEQLLNLTLLGARMLVYAGVPVDALPPDRPELAAPYPLREVLARGSAAAVDSRLDELPPLRLTLLGDVSASLMDERLPLTDRQRELVTLLALGADRERIGEEIWPEVDAKKQRNSLGVLLNMLRKVLEPWGAPTFILESGLARFTSDAQELREALAEGDHERVLALYAGPLAPGLTLPLVDDERQALHEEVLQALFDGAGAAALLPSAPKAAASATAAVGSVSEAEFRVRLLKRLLELDPLHEEGLQALLTLLVRLGRRREAQRHFSRFEADLAAETGLAPQAATAELLAG